MLWGVTPLEKAKMTRHQPIVDMLERHDAH